VAMAAVGMHIVAFFPLALAKVTGKRVDADGLQALVEAMEADLHKFMSDKASEQEPLFEQAPGMTRGVTVRAAHATNAGKSPR
jgi:hypothetical protein